MSQNSKNLGLKKLSTKRSNKIKETNTGNDQLTHFDSFISLSNSNQGNGSKDDSLVIVESTTSKTKLSPDSETDCFEFPKKKSVNDSTTQCCLEKTSLSPVPIYSHKNVQDGNEMTENKAISNETCSKYVRVSDLFNDSSLLFQNKTSSFSNNKNNDSEPIVVKILSNDHKNEVKTSLGDVSKRDLKVEEPPPDSRPEIIQQCPICLKTVSKYVIHMKSCAAKNKLNTQQLLSALKLHQKQLAERKELGLDIPAQSYRAKVSPKRSRANDKKVSRDANLQLALALSASLHSAEEDEVIQEAEALEAAGLTVEANQRLGTLEQFGFASAVAPQPRSAQGSSKSRPLPRTLLLERSKEERERIVTEKIAIVLINEDENITLDTFNFMEPNIKSKLLKKAWDKECQLWAKAHCDAEEDRSRFYVDRLLEFVSPCKVEVGAGLRRLSQLPGRLNTPAKETAFDRTSTPNSSLSGEVNVFDLTTPAKLSGDNQNLDTATTVVKSVSHVELNNKLLQDWISLVDNPELSDLEIQCADGNISAHTLVFHVRCPKVLHSVNQDDCRKLIVLKDCSRTAAIALLEFVYAGSLSKIFHLNQVDFESLTHLVDEFDLTELQTHLGKFDKTRESLSGNKSKSENCKQELFKVIDEPQNDLDGIENLSPGKNLSPHAQRGISVESNSKSYPEPEICPSIELESLDSSYGRGSPDLFGESNVTENKSFSHQSKQDLDILASLVGKATGVIEEKILNKTDCSKAKSNVVIVSPCGSLANESSSGKRKALESSDSEEPSLSKKPCSELSKRLTTDNLNEGEDVFDLTQSSNSDEDIRQGSRKDVDTDLTQNNEVLCLSDSNNCDSMEGLTQKDSSLPYSPENISSTCKKTPESPNKSQDYFEPVWDGYDDYLHFNYTPINTPAKPSPGKRSSQNTSSKKGSHFSFVKTNVQESSVLTPKISSDVNYISSDSNSPKQSMEKILDEYSWKNKNNFDLERFESKGLKGSKKFQEIEKGTVTNSRKSLSSQFDNPINSPVNFSPELSSFTKSSQLLSDCKKCVETSPQTSNGNLKKSPLKRDSLAAMQRLLEDSFDINDSVFAHADALLAEGAKSSKEQISPQPSTSSESLKINVKLQENKNSLMTPSPEIITSDNVTPLPDYSAMKTPSLKRELSKYGLKRSLGKRKAKLMLRYIYDQTHPFVPDPGGSREEQVEVFKQPLRSPMKSPQKIQSGVNLVDSESDTEESCSQKSTSTVSSSATLPEESYCEFDDVLTQDVCSVGDLKTAIRSLIVNNADLHRRVLLYEPIFLDEFMGMLKSNGVKSKVNDVMDYLDEQCITFRTNSWKATNEKRKQKNLKKKAKTVSKCETSTCRKKSTSTSNMSVTSPSKEQSNPVKKRGRPKKNKQDGNN